MLIFFFGNPFTKNNNFTETADFESTKTSERRKQKALTYRYSTSIIGKYLPKAL